MFTLCLAPRVASADRDSLAVEENRARGAMLRSLTLPGWGQFYNGRRWKGSVIAVVQTGSAVGYFVRREQIRGTPARNYFLFSTIGIVLYSMADAYVDAHLDRVDWAKIKAGMTPDGTAQVRLQMAFR